MTVVRELEAGEMTFESLRRKYGIPGYWTVQEWAHKYGRNNVGKIIRVEKPNEIRERKKGSVNGIMFIFNSTMLPISQVRQVRLDPTFNLEARQAGVTVITSHNGSTIVTFLVSPIVSPLMGPYPIAASTDNAG